MCYDGNILKQILQFLIDRAIVCFEVLVQTARVSHGDQKLQLMFITMQISFDGLIG